MPILMLLLNLSLENALAITLRLNLVVNFEKVDADSNLSPRSYLQNINFGIIEGAIKLAIPIRLFLG